MIAQIKTNDSLTEKIIGCCFKVHSELGPGFNERIYFNALKLVLEEKGLKYDTEKEFKVKFHEKKIGSLRLDLVIEDKVVLEVKSVTGPIPEFFIYQIISYLKVS
jgi:GxxExxY protein